MKAMILAIAAVAGLAGCVVAPVPYSGSAYEYSYPTVESQYIWEPSVGVYYYHSPRGRVYMQRGWTYRDHGRHGRFHRNDGQGRIHR